MWDCSVLRACITFKLLWNKASKPQFIVGVFWTETDWLIFRSHDGFHTDENGNFVADTPQYADQRKVFDDLGQGVLNNAVKGLYIV